MRSSTITRTPLSFQDMIARLTTFWAGRGCVIALPYDLEVGAGTMCPETFFRVLGPEPWRVAYVQPSRRPADGRYGENPNRLFKHTQMQVILKPPPADIQDVFLESLAALGMRRREHDIRFEEDNWEAPTLGAWGVGWQVMLDGLEITQFTYFQQCGGTDLDPISVELTYGLERIAAFLQNAEDVYQILWNESVTYGAMRQAEEFEFSVYDFEAAGTDVCRQLFGLYEAEASRLLGQERRPEGSTGTAERAPAAAAANNRTPPSGPDEGEGAGTSGFAFERLPLRKAYDLTLKCSHLFNILDARGAISVSERVALIARVRRLACLVASVYLERGPRAGVRA